MSGRETWRRSRVTKRRVSKITRWRKFLEKLRLIDTPLEHGLLRFERHLERHGPWVADEQEKPRRRVKKFSRRVSGETTTRRIPITTRTSFRGIFAARTARYLARNHGKVFRSLPKCSIDVWMFHALAAGRHFFQISSPRNSYLYSQQRIFAFFDCESPLVRSLRWVCTLLKALIEKAIVG